MVSGARLELLELRTLLSAASDVVVEPHLVLGASATHASTPRGYWASDIRTAYGFNQVSLDGKGQTIAIVDAYNHPTIAGDLSTFDKVMGLPDLSTSQFKVVNQTGGTALPATNSGWASEIALDVEWAHAIAPGANILLVEARSASMADLMSAVDYARNAAGVSVVSMSWGGSEFNGETTYDRYFTTPAGHPNVSFFVASGDNGAGAEYPASSPNVVAVGGTTLSLTATATYSSESGWSGSGGGSSAYETATSSQKLVRSGNARSTPDVAYDANPNTGFAVYDSVPYGGASGWAVFGGTSAGAPQWAALVALANQARASAGSLTTAQMLSSLYGQYSAGASTAFNDITSGSNAVYVSNGRGRAPTLVGGSATTGYDTVTGMGTPKVAAVVKVLAGASATPTATQSSVTQQTTTSLTARRSNVSASEVDVARAATVRAQDAAALVERGAVASSIEPAATASVAGVVDATLRFGAPGRTYSAFIEPTRATIADLKPTTGEVVVAAGPAASLTLSTAPSVAPDIAWGLSTTTATPMVEAAPTVALRSIEWKTASVLGLGVVLLTYRQTSRPTSKASKSRAAWTSCEDLVPAF